MKRPYITLKYAQSLDGKIAAKNGSSRWISSLQGRKFTHKLRSRNDAILIGVNTVLSDNPSLTTRLVKGKNPIRIVIDGKLRTPIDAKIIKNTQRAKTIIITTEKAPKEKIGKFKKKGIEFIILPASKGGNIDLRRIIRILYEKGVRSILVEGGRGVITSFLKARLVDKIIVIISPKFLGKGIESIGDLGISNIKAALPLRLKDIKILGKDIIYTAFIRR